MDNKYKNHYDYLEKISPIFSQKLSEKNPEFTDDLSGFISWRGDTAKGYHYSNESTIVEYRKSLIYLMTFARPYSGITGYKKDIIHQLYLEFLPLILECESMV